ncbi:MAG: GGDEF domain-containing protein [Verrucomicrobia bacterium]|nr:GGDEF domain-containing protein [Verrucomicrobiota bacterium]
MNRRSALLARMRGLSDRMTMSLAYDQTPEAKGRVPLAIFFNCLALVIVTAFMVESLALGHIYHGAFLLTMIVLVILNYLLFRITHRALLYYDLTILTMAINSLYLLATGGVENTGALWIYLYPLLALYLQGIRKGALSLLGLIVGSFVVFFAPARTLVTANYSPAFISRFVASMTSVTILSFVYEYSTQRTYRRLIAATAMLERLAKTDELTGLASRRAVLEHLELELQRFVRYRETFAVILCDIDHFKQFNDTHGHDCGDLVLQAVSEILLESGRKVDIAGRWGGEEFLLVLPATELEGAVEVAERLRKAVEAFRIDYDGSLLSITLSCGVAVWREGDGDHDALIKRADICLYQAKEEGRNRVVGR